MPPEGNSILSRLGLLLILTLIIVLGCGKGEYDRQMESRLQELRSAPPEATEGDESEESDAMPEQGNDEDTAADEEADPEELPDEDEPPSDEADDEENLDEADDTAA